MENLVKVKRISASHGKTGRSVSVVFSQNGKRFFILSFGNNRSLSENGFCKNTLHTDGTLKERSPCLFYFFKLQIALFKFRVIVILVFFFNTNFVN